MKKLFLPISLFVFAFFASQLNVFSQQETAPFGWCTYGGSVTGGGNGSSVTVSSNSAFRSAVSGSTPRVVYVNGTIDLGVANYCKVGSNKTIIGIGSNARLVHGGIRLDGVSNIIIRNIAFSDARDPNWQCESPTEGGQPSNCRASNADYDLCKISGGARRIWIDHCSFTNNQTSYLAYDGTCDITQGSDLITISYCRFERNHKGMSLIGGSDTDYGEYRITYAYNYISTDSRNPMVRHGRVHLLNNYYRNVSDYCVGVRTGSEIFAESNYFENCKDPGKQSSGNGRIRDYYNMFSGCSPNGFENPVSSVNWMPENYYSYRPIYPYDVPSHVNANAGPGKNLGGGSNPNPDPSNGTINGTYSIIATHSGKALDTYEWGTSNGTNIVQWEYWGGDAQRFNITPVDGIWHRITPVIASGQALDVNGISVDDGANINTWEYWGGAGQQFRFQSAGSGVWRIINRNSEKCLDVEGISQEDGANVVQWTCIAGNNNQVFELINQKNAKPVKETTDIDVYPNPANEYLNVALPDELRKGVSVRIINSLGQVVVDETYISGDVSRLDISRLKAGMYIIQIQKEQSIINKMFTKN